MCSNEDDPGQTDLKSVSTSPPALAANRTKPADTTSRNPNRRSNKPIMEKRRRARINNCLNELKSILLEAMRKDPARHSKLEKADILELTVAHLKELHRTSRSSDDAASRYRAGYLHCISEVERYLTQSAATASASLASPKLEGGDTDSQITCRLLTHLADSLVLGSGSFNSNEKTASMLLSSPNLASSDVFAIHGNAESEINYNNNVESFNHNKSQITATTKDTAATTTTPTNCNSDTGTSAATFNVTVSGDTPIISLVPSRLPSGEIAFIVPGFNSSSFQGKIATAAGNHQSGRLVVNANEYECLRSVISNSNSQHSVRKSQSLSPEMPLELMVSSSSGTLTNYRDHHRHIRSSSASPSSTSSSNLSSPLSPVLVANYNQINASSGVYQYPSQSQVYQQQQHQFTNIQPAHHQHQRYHKAPYQLQYEYEHQSAMDDMNTDDNDNEPLALVKVKRDKELVVDLSCWRPW